MASVSQRKDRPGRPWRARVKWRDGRWKDLAVPAAIKGRAAVQRWANEKELEERNIREGRHGGPSHEKVASAVGRYLRAIRHMPSQGKVGDRLRLHVLPRLGELPFAQVRPSDIQAVIATMQDKGLGPGYQYAIFSAMRSFFEWLRRDGAITTNPVTTLKAPRVPTPTPKALSMEQVYSVANAAHTPGVRNLILLAFFTGARPGELRAARWKDVDLEAGHLRIERTSGRNTTKTGRARVAFLAPPAVELLLKMRRELPAPPRPEEPVLTNRDGRPFQESPLWRSVKAALRAAGIVRGWEIRCRKPGCGFKEDRRKQGGEKCPRCGWLLRERPLAADVSVKDLRSSAATRLYETEGAHVAQAQLGHTSLRTTEKHYRAVRAPHIAAAVSRAFSTPPPDDEKPLTH